MDDAYMAGVTEAAGDPVEDSVVSPEDIMDTEMPVTGTETAVVTGPAAGDGLSASTVLGIAQLFVLAVIAGLCIFNLFSGRWHT